MKTLEEMREELDLSPIQLILLSNTGSMTSLLEGLFGKIRVETEFQKVVKSTAETAQLLDVEVGTPVNHRVVRLTGLNGRCYVHATSFSPISRLKESFKSDIMRMDQPIGQILLDHSIESRREILGYDWEKAGKKFEEIFQVPEETLILRRNYNIIHRKKPLINITEVFPSDLFR
jgi:chorismate-pyruvate lyase